MKIFLLIIVSALSIAVVTPAQASSLELLGGTNWYHMSDGNVPSGQANDSSGSQMGYQLGLGLNFHTIPGVVSFEVDGLYDHSSQAFGSGSLTTNQVEVPALFHLWLGRQLSIGAGGFYSFGVGNVTETSSTGSQIYQGNASGLNLANSNYGALGDVRMRFPMSMGHLFIDARYLFGLKSLNTSGSDALQSREAQLMVGYSFLFGGYR